MLIEPTQANEWNHICIEDGTKIYVNGEWNRALTLEEIKTLYNNGLGLTFIESISKNLMPNKSVKFWIKS